jgi:hypothetical protein
MMRFLPLSLLPLLLLTSCGGSKAPPPVDLKPIGNAVEFVGICIVLAVVVMTLANLIMSGHDDQQDGDDQ